jgi:hypothetical protein
VVRVSEDVVYNMFRAGRAKGGGMIRMIRKAIKGGMKRLVVVRSQSTPSWTNLETFKPLTVSCTFFSVLPNQLPTLPNTFSATAGTESDESWRLKRDGAVGRARERVDVARRAVVVAAANE